MIKAVTKTAFAKAAEITQGRVSQLLAEGLPVDADGKIDPDAGKAWIAANIDPDLPARRRPAEGLDAAGEAGDGTGRRRRRFAECLPAARP